ncbi:hypothetical protein K3729_05115 [Rhodobacteraceae bacterium S2214]|nr:hypothetical protein K3729_05115 [Rhodobacteraceae bacterium S2214]
MKRILLIAIGIGAVIGFLLYVVLSKVSAGARETVREFTIAVSTEAYDDALALMHPEFAKEVPVERLEDMFVQTKPYTTVKITSFEINNSRATLSGTAETDDGCVSALDFNLLSEQVVGFSITPLCRFD